MRDLSHKIGTTLQPVFISKKLEQDLKPKENKPPIVNQQCVVYSFSCDLCDTDYVGYTARHQHQRTVEHKNSAIGKHFLEAHGDTSLLKESQFRILQKFRESVKENLIASSLRCFLSRTQSKLKHTKLIPSVRNFLLERTLQHVDSLCDCSIVLLSIYTFLITIILT